MDLTDPSITDAALNEAPYTGPLKIDVFDNDTGDRELHLSFVDDFRILRVHDQSTSFQEFIQYLTNEIQKLGENDADHAGMVTILQVCERLQPLIDANKLPLEETIVVTFDTQNPFGNIQFIN